MSTTTEHSAEHSEQPWPHALVRASAGTGKTYDLSTRYLKLLCGGAAPGTILATTFTRKAAGEILERVLLRLCGAAHSNKIARQAFVSLCCSLHRVSICTLDSFFHRMAVCYRHELALPLRFTIVGEDDPQVAQLRRQAVDAMLAQAVPDDQDWQTLVGLIRRMNHGDHPRSVAESLETLFSGGLYKTFRLHPQRELWSKLKAPQAPLDRPALAEAINELRDLADVLPQDKRWFTAWKKSRQAAEQRDWKTFLGSGLPKKLQQGEGEYYGKPIEGWVLDAYQPLIYHAEAAIIDQLAQRTQATHSLLERFDEHFNHLRHEQGVLLYDDIPLFLERLSESDGVDLADLYYRLDAAVTHLLLDEFQDTSLGQWRLLGPFAHEVCSHSDGSHTFYCVGDVKQAIYGWRGGCAELFDQIENELHLPAEALSTKSASYRSSQVVLDAVNRVFETLPGNEALEKANTLGLSGAVSDWLKGFEPHTTHLVEQKGYVELVTSLPLAPGDDAPGSYEEEGDDADGAASTTATRHEQYTADYVAKLHAAAPGRSIGVLVNKNETVVKLLGLLRKHNLPASGEGGSPINDDPAVEVILSALTLADHPSHTVAAFHTAHSPLAQTLGLRWGDPPSVNRAGRKVRQALLNQGYADLITQWSKQLAPLCSERGVRRLEQLIELADQHDRQATLRPGDFVRWVNAVKVEDPTAAPIRVMTINKAKGLEFDAVVLPELDRVMLTANGGNTQQAWVHREGTLLGVAIGVYRAADKTTCQLAPELEEAQQQHQYSQLLDDLSKLYVAMTRARHALHMVIPPLQRTSKGKTSARGWTSPSFAAILRRALSTFGEDESPDGEQTLYTHGQPDWHRHTETPQPDARTVQAPPTPIQIALRQTEQPLPARSWPRVTPSSLESDSRVKAADLLAIEQSPALQRGSVIHAWLAQIEWLDPRDPRLDIADNDLLAIAQQEAPDQDKAWAVARLEEFKRLLSQSGVVGALSLPAVTGSDTAKPVLWRERAFAVRVGDRLLQGKFDRVVVHYQNGKPARAELIDFKTDRVTPNTPETLDDVVGRYRQQVEAYRAALSAMLGLPHEAIHASLLFVHSGLTVDITPQPRA